MKVERCCKPICLYPVSGLPFEWQILVHQHRSKKLEEEQAEADQGKMLVRVQNALIQAPCRSHSVFRDGVPRAKADKALYAARLVGEYRSYLRKDEVSHGSKMRVQGEFVAAYNLGTSGLYPDLYEAVGQVTLDQLRRWDNELLINGNDPYAIADGRGFHRAGATIVTEDQMKILLPIMLSPNRLNISEGIRAARGIWRERGIPAAPCNNTYRNAVEKWKRENYPRWIYCREGWKALNEECLLHLDRDYSKINVGDILVGDGHRFNFRMIEPITGRSRRMTLFLWIDMKSNYPCGWDIALNEDTQVITTSYYRANLALGKKARVAYTDNGKALRKKVFKSVSDFRQSKFVSIFEKVGAKTIFAWPYHAESKPIEGFFRILGEFERLCPTYCGSSIERKPPRLKRNEKLHRRLYEVLTGGREPTIEDVHIALAAWFDDYSRRPQGGHLKGRTPYEVFMEGRGVGLSQEECWELKMNLLPSMTRRVTRDGVRLPWSEEKYYHDGMFGKAGQIVEVRYDQFGRESILVFDEHGRFLYEARQKPKTHPAATHLGTVEEQEELKRQIQITRSQGKSVTGPLKQLLENEIIPEAKRRQEALGFGAGALPRLAPPAKPPEPEPDKWWEITDADRERADRSSGKREAWLKQRKEAQERAFNEHMAEEEIARSFDEALVLKAQGFELSEELQNVVFVYMRSEDYRQHREQWELRELVYREKYRKKTVGSMD